MAYVNGNENNNAAGNGTVLPPARKARVTHSGCASAIVMFLFTCVLAAVMTAVLCVLPGVFIWAALETYDPSENMSGAAAAVFAVPAGLVILLILAAAGKAIAEAFGELRSELAYFRSAAESRDPRTFRQKKRIAVAVTCVLLGAAAVSLIAEKAVHLKQSADAYENALQYMEAQQYTQAREQLEPIAEEKYKNAEALLYLCEAHLESKQGNTFTAYEILERIRPETLSEEQQKALNAFKNELKTENDRKDRELAALQRRQHEERIVNGIPFVGMEESRIADTTLGRPDPTVRHNTEMINGTVYSANLYDWYRGGSRIYTARCIQGKVYQVWDERADPVTPYTPSGSKKHYEFPDLDDYLDAEDLYEWYYDDFYDYEEAEEALDGLD